HSAVEIELAERDSAQRLRVVALGVVACKANTLTAAQPGCLVHNHAAFASKLHIALGAGNEKRPGAVQTCQVRKADEAAIHDVKSTGLRNEQIEDVDLVDLAIADMDKRRDVATQIQ